MSAAEHEMSSYTFRSSTPIDMSETDMTWRYKSNWDADDDDLSAQLENILNPDLDTHQQEKNILLILDKLNRSENDSTHNGYYLQHSVDEIIYVMTNTLMKKHKKAEKALKKFKKNFEKGSNITSWLIQHEYTVIFESQQFDLKQYIGRDHEAHFWSTMRKLIMKYFQIEIEMNASPIIHWPLVWSQTFKCALSRKVKEISPDKVIALSPTHRDHKMHRFDEANLHHIANKTAEDWYKELLYKRDYTMDTKQKITFIKQNKRVCDGCGHNVKANKLDIKWVIMYTGGWPTQEKFIFHDEHCLKLRKYLESIRQFVFDVDMCLYKHRNVSALTNWRRLLHLIQNKDYVLSINQKVQRPLKAVDIEPHVSVLENGKNKYRTSKIPKTDRATFRRKRKLAQYHLQMELIQETQEETQQDVMDEDFEFVYGINGDKLNEIPKIIRFMDVAQFGPSLFVYCLRSLEVKDRCGLWIVIQYIMTHLPTSSAISLLILHKNELLRFPKDNLNKLCLKVIQSSQFPIATALYLCGYMSSCLMLCGNKQCHEFAQLYTKIAIELCLFIESDHLLAILLEIPSDISELSILDICIEYKLTDFLYSHRLRPIFNQMWTQFKYLDPSKSFEMKPYSYADTFNHLRKSPSSFYYSPQGLFITEVFYYILYMIIFTLWIINLQYPYNLPISMLEMVLWIENGGYFVKEFMEAVYKKNSYFAHFSKYFDLLIVLNWIVIAAIRWPWAWLTWDEYILYDDITGTMDVSKTKNQPLTIAYMIAVGVQSILIWTRSILFLQRSNKTGPLIHTIFHLISDVWQFTILLMLFLIGCMFALYYIFGGDMGCDDIEDCSNLESAGDLLLYMFQALLGQQDWDMLQPSQVNGFGDVRSKISEIIVVFFSMMGNIALLNLLIALMASVYETNSPLTAKQVNYAAIVNTIELVNKEAVLPPPFNIFVMMGLIVYCVFEMIIYFLSCSRWTYNISRIGWTNYALNRDWICMEKEEMDKLILRHNSPKGLNPKCTNNKYESVSNKRDSDSSDEDDEKYNKSNNTKDTLCSTFWSHKDEEMLFKYEEQRGIVYRNHRFIQKKEFSSINCSSNCWSRCRSLKLYCRFCRNRMTSQGDISIYLFLFRHFKALDESDKTLLINLTNDKRLCPSCFRAVKLYNNDGDSQRLWRWQVAMEIISFYVFMIVGYIPILLFLLIPALFSCIGHRFTSWTSNFTNDSETNAKYKEQIQLNGDNVIFVSSHAKSDEYKHVSDTIYGEYCKFKKDSNKNNIRKICRKERKKGNGDKLANNDDMNGYNGVLSCVNEENLNLKSIAMLTQKKTWDELSPVVDSPIPCASMSIHNKNSNNHSINNTYKEILMQLTEIRKEVNVLKKYNKKSISIDLKNKRRDSKQGLIDKSRNKKKSKQTHIIDENNDEKEDSIPSMPSVPPSLQINDSNNNKQMHIKPSKQQQIHEAINIYRNSPQNDNEYHHIYSQSHDIFHHEDQQSLHDIIDDISVGSMMTATTANMKTKHGL